VAELGRPDVTTALTRFGSSLQAIFAVPLLPMTPPRGPSMRLRRLDETSDITRSLQTDIQAELRSIERAVARGTLDAGQGLKTELRRQVASAGLD
jgi:hypothetical protein